MNADFLISVPAFSGRWRCLALLFCACSASAAGPTAWLDSWADPLATRPALLDQGSALPGDSSPARCPADSIDEQRLGLEQAVDIALCNNPRVKSAWLGIKVQAAALGIAQAAYLPTVSGNTGRQRTITGYVASPLPTTAVTGNTAYVSLNWRLFDFGARAAERQSANFLLLGAIQSHDAILQKTMQDTVQAYFDTQSAHAAWYAKEEDERIASATLLSAQRRESSGAVSHGDTLQAATAQARAVLERNRALGDYHKASAVLVYAMGLATGASVTLADIDTAADLPGTVLLPGKGSDSIDAWLQEARRSHPAILAARSQWQAALGNVTSTRAAGLPTIDFATDYYKNGYPNQGISASGSHIVTVGITISIPIFTGFSQTYKVRQAEAVAAQREADVEDTEHTIAMELVKADADARSAHENLGASAQLLNSAQDALASSQRKYARGATDILEMLNTQKDLADAKQERVRAIAEWRSARLRLLAATGQLNHLGLDEGTLTRGAGD